MHKQLGDRLYSWWGRFGRRKMLLVFLLYDKQTFVWCVLCEILVFCKYFVCKVYL